MEQFESVDRAPKLMVTADGSHTLYIESMDEHYHSVNGAVQESNHVFIQAGLDQVQKEEIHILEVGFGTGLNAFLTLLEAKRRGVHVRFITTELYPLGDDIVAALNFTAGYSDEEKALFRSMHACEWNKPVAITDYFTILKLEGDINTMEFEDGLDLIYFDAFAPDKQAEMWSEELFQRIYDRTNKGGILTTYCAKGVVRRTMQAVGFTTERLPGPPGKREMLRATK